MPGMGLLRLLALLAPATLPAMVCLPEEGLGVTALAEEGAPEEPESSEGSPPEDCAPAAYASATTPTAAPAYWPMVVITSPSEPLAWAATSRRRASGARGSATPSVVEHGEGPGRDRTGATERRPVEGGTGAACARAAKDAVLVSADATM